MSRDRSIKETKDGSRTDGAEDNTNTRLRNDIAVVPPANKSELDTRTGSKQSYERVRSWRQAPARGSRRRLTDGGVVVLREAVADELHGHGLETRSES